ncbi:hypothetical protein DFQ29_002696, partial [Apophysomyces sp. BC1021]
NVPSTLVTSHEEDLERDLVSAFDRLRPLSSAEPVLRGAYFNTSRTTQWRRKNMMEEALKKHRPINTYFHPLESSSTPVDDSLDDDDHESQVDDMDVNNTSFDWKDKDQLLKAHEDIQKIIETFADPANDTEKSHIMRYFSVKFYIEQLLKEGAARGTASKLAANFFYVGKEANEHDYRSRRTDAFVPIFPIAATLRFLNPIPLLYASAL